MGLLRNYDNFMALQSLVATESEVVGDATSFDDKHLCMKDTSGNLRTLWRRAEKNANPLGIFGIDTGSFSSCDTQMSTLIAGSGNSEVTYDDYKLESIFTNSQVQKVSHICGDTIYNETDKTWERTYTLVCLAKEDLTIKEIGVLHRNYRANASSGYYYALVYRKVLDTPVEAPANSSFILSFTTKVSANPNKPTDYDANAIVG